MIEDPRSREAVASSDGLTWEAHSADHQLSAREAGDLAGELAERHRELAVAAAIGREGVARAEALAVGDMRPAQAPAARASAQANARWGWRKAVRFAVERRMYTPEYLRLYARYMAQRLRSPDVVLQGMVFIGRRVELFAKRRHARLALGPWCWVGDDNTLRAHEGNLRLGPKVVLGRANVINAYLDIEVGQGCLFSDWIYVCDFDHRFERVDVSIRKQGIVKTPVRIGEDVWVGEKASILRGADVGAGSVIGSQTLVRGRIPPFSVVVGSPARIVRSRLPKGMTAEEALDLQRRGTPIPGDPLDA